jgi:hypothetical protein
MSTRIITRLSQIPISNIGQLPAVLKSEENRYNSGPTLAMLPKSEFFDGNAGLRAFAHAVAETRPEFLCCAIMSSIEFVIVGYETRYRELARVVTNCCIRGDPCLSVQVFLTNNSIRVVFDTLPACGWIYQAAVNTCLALMAVPRPDRVVLLTFQDKFERKELAKAFKTYVPACLFSVHKCDAIKQVASLWHGMEANKIYTCE